MCVICVYVRYLNVTLQYPTADQLGRYECQIHGADPVDDQDVMFSTSLDLTNDAPTITQLVRFKSF